MEKLYTTSPLLDPIELNNKRILQEIKEAKSVFNKTYNNLEQKIYSYIEPIEKKVIKFDSIEKEIANIFAENKLKSEKIEEILSKISSIETKNLNHYCSFSLLQKEFITTRNKLDKLYLNNLSLPGYIGECCKYKNLQEFFRFVIDKFHELDLYKDVNKEKLKSYDKKISTLLTQFKVTESAVKDVVFDYTNNKLDPLQKKFDEMEKEIYEKVNQIKVDNMCRLIEVKRETEKALEVKNEYEDNKNQVSNDISHIFNKIEKLNKIIKNLNPRVSLEQKKYIKNKKLSNKSNINLNDNKKQKNFAFVTETNINNKNNKNLKRAASISANNLNIFNFYSKKNNGNSNNNIRKSKNIPLKNFLNIDNNINNISKNHSGTSKDIAKSFSSNVLIVISEDDKSSSSFLEKKKKLGLPKSLNISSSCSSSNINEVFNDSAVLKNNSSRKSLGEISNNPVSINQKTPNKKNSNDFINNNINKSIKPSVVINEIEENKDSNIENNNFCTTEMNSLNISSNKSSKSSNKLNFNKKRNSNNFKSLYSSEKNDVKNFICMIPYGINNSEVKKKLSVSNDLNSFDPLLKNKSFTNSNKNKKYKLIPKIENTIKNSTIYNENKKKNIKNLFYEKIQELNSNYSENISKNHNDSIKPKIKFHKSFNGKHNILNESTPKSVFLIPKMKKSQINSRKKSNFKLNVKEKKKINPNLSIITKPVNFKKTEKLNI